MSFPVLSKPYPNRVTIELTNVCNRACTGCPRHKMQYPKGYMSKQLFTKIVDELPLETVIVPFFRGESLLHPSLTDFMEKLRSFKTVQLATNGDHLHKHADSIIKSCSFISLSCHKFTDGERWISFLLKAKHEGVRTQVSIVETLIPTGLKTRFIRKWLKHADQVRIYAEHSHTGFGDSANLSEVIDEALPCHKPFTDLVAYYDGKVALCNHDWNNMEPLGNLNIQTVKEVWNGLPYEGVREYNWEGQRRQIKSCHYCDQWKAPYTMNKMLGELYSDD